MPVNTYLPSAQFVVIVTAIALSGGLVLAAQYITNDSPSTLTLSSTNNGTLGGAADWKAALYDVQGINPLEIQSGASVRGSLDALFEEAKTSNVTDTIGRSLLLNLSEAKAQGLGNDIPTQEKLLAEATQHLSLKTGRVYARTELNVVLDGSAAIRTYGNAVIEIINNHPRANMQDTYVAIGNAVDTADTSALTALNSIGAAYASITKELLTLPVPQTLSPMHLLIVNNFSQITASYTDMQEIITDPLRGFGGLQTYNALTGETGRMFTNIAQSFSKNGILFDKDEPGSAWSVFLPQ